MPTANPSRLIALGASNLTRMLPVLTECARSAADGPVEVLAALGFGRSYGIRSRFLFRALPGIDGSGLWEALAERPPAKAATGIVMDVGNDVLYGIEVPTILAWVERALVRLRPAVDRLAVAGLPPDLARVGSLRYGLVRTVLVPSCKLARATALAHAEELRDGLEQLATRYDAALIAMQPAWFGFDPIHVKRRYWRRLAAGLLGHTAPRARPPCTLDRVRRALRLRLAEPQQRWRLRTEVRAEQPTVRFCDGSSVALY